MGKRFWLGIFLLVLLLAAGLLVHFVMSRTYCPLAEMLTEAADEAMEENWDRALPLAHRAKNQWTAKAQLTASLADQTPMDETDRLFAELTAFSETRNREHFCAICRQLAVMCRAMSEAHSPAWWNLM